MWVDNRHVNNNKYFYNLGKLFKIIIKSQIEIKKKNDDNDDNDNVVE